MIELIKSAAVSALVAGLITGIGVHYLQSYLDAKRKESEEKAAKRRQARHQADVLEAKRKRAEGRLFFWMYDAIVKGVDHANGDLHKAFSDYNAVDEEQKAFDQEQLAYHLDENRQEG